MPAARPVLVVEDDEDIRKLIVEELSTEGFEPHPVEAGDRALELLARDGRRWIVLLDLHLPRLDGLSVLGALEKMSLSDDALRIVIVSAMAPDPALLQRRFVRGYLQKPFRFASLLALVRAQAVDVGAG